MGDGAGDDEAARQAWIDGLLARGEAVLEGPDSAEPLPPGVTHVVVEGADGRREARRRRFS